MPTEIPVRLHAPLRGVRIVAPDAALPPLPAASGTTGVKDVTEAPAPHPPPAPDEPPPVDAINPTLVSGPEEESPSLPPPPPVHHELAQRLDEERAMIEQALAAVSRQVRELHDERSRERREWRRMAVELGVTVAARLLHDRIVAGDFPVETLVREMIGQLDGGPVVVYLAPEDLALLHTRLEGRPLADRQEGLSYQADPALGRGDCRVEAGDAFVLSELDVQLAEMRLRLLRSLGHAQP